MRIIYLFIFLISCTITYSQDSPQLVFFQTDWGRQVSWDEFCKQTKEAGYNGIETWLPADQSSQQKLKEALEKYDLLVGFLNGTDRSIPFEQSLEKYKRQFSVLIAWKPAYINCHTGSDFFSFDQNKAFITAANNISEASGIPIYHETHRGRFSFNLPDTQSYLKAIPDLKLTLDISHWMVVHESLLQGKDAALETVVDRSHHIHARIGHAEGPQVNDPRAGEWQKALERHLDIWEKVIRQKWKQTGKPFTVTTEFGPPNYMPTLPYTQLPVSSQWKANVFMMESLKQRMNIE
ncbi:sugar phosphate isomerase/epimerase family protein [Flagellimonas myxillae]|uniref:sugar phosphate isomerase/epimerase family protein n=1 Tax=Flagellimonas myxillae TaxID=2942214 RepID=UPI00201F333B|nr:sugar phosphate isomerase/epimerase [Muricauda myxillae]MCL6265045.1 sugar phosphate isomerase/epimerase [Muricauda myxillae]